jgi:hypothetical protein
VNARFPAGIINVWHAHCEFVGTVASRRLSATGRASPQIGVPTVAIAGKCTDPDFVERPTALALEADPR